MIAAGIVRFGGDAGWVFSGTLGSLGFAALLARAVCAPIAPGTMASRRERGLAWLGLISYSLYLWHKPLLLEWTQQTPLVFRHPALFLGATLAFVAASLVVAAASYWAIERPALLLRRRLARRAAAPPPVAPEIRATPLGLP